MDTSPIENLEHDLDCKFLMKHLIQLKFLTVTQVYINC